VADRIELFRDKVGTSSFARKDYLQAYKDISQPTASRDLKWAVDNDILEKIGANRLTKYKYTN
jgi:Fic family protein